MTRAAQLAQALAVQELGDGWYAVLCAGTCGGAGSHVVTIGADGATCSCPAGTFGRACRHVTGVRQYLLLGPIEATKLAKALASSAGPGLERDVPLPVEPR